MEKEKPHALEMGKEEAQAHETKAEAKGGRTLVVYNPHSPFLYQDLWARMSLSFS